MMNKISNSPDRSGVPTKNRVGARSVPHAGREIRAARAEGDPCGVEAGGSCGGVVHEARRSEGAAAARGGSGPRQGRRELRRRPAPRGGKRREWWRGARRGQRARACVSHLGAGGALHAGMRHGGARGAAQKGNWETVGQRQGHGNVRVQGSLGILSVS